MLQVCPNHCPPTCSPDEYVCHPEPDRRGCVGPSTCHRKKTNFEGEFCTDICPVHQCEKGSIKHDGGVSSEGCLLQDLCLPCSKIEIGDNWGYIGSGDGSGNSESSVTVEVPEGYACPSSVDSSS